MGHNGLQLLKDSFILEKETVEGDRERGALVPSLLSHGGHRHDISGLKDWHSGHAHYPPPVAIALHPSHFAPPPSPSFLAAASLDVTFCQASWGHCHCLHAKQSPSEGRERKQRASHGTSQEQGWLPQPTLHRPLFWLRGSGVTPLPPSPLVSLLQPPHALSACTSL